MICFKILDNALKDIYDDSGNPRQQSRRMLNKKDLRNYYCQGNNEEVLRKELIRYGEILEDESWEDLKGFWRKLKIFHGTMYWTITLNNGRVCSLVLENTKSQF